MRNILSKQSMRFLITLEHLYYNEYASFEELAELCHVTSQTIQDDISKLNDFIEPLYIEPYSQNECHLIHKNNVSVDFIYSCILKNSTEYWLLEKVFFERHTRLEDYADSLYISLSTLKRIILRVNKQLKNYGFQISTNPIELVGDERLIRNMFINYFREKYPERGYRFTDVQKKVFDQLLMSLMDWDEQYYNFPDIEKVRIILFVSLTRLRNGHAHDPKKIAEIPHKYRFKILENNLFKQAFKSLFQIELTHETMLDLTFPIAGNRFAFNQAEFQVLCEKDPSLEIELIQITKLINDIGNSLNIELDDEQRNKLTLELINAHLGIIAETYLLYNYKHNFVVNLTKDFPLVYHFLYTHLINNEYFGTYEEHEIDEIIYVLITHWDNLLFSIQFSYPKFKAGIYMNSDIEHTKFMASILNKKHYSRFTFEPIDALTHAEALAEFDQYDLIVTNISNLTSDHERIVSVDLYPSKIGFQKIYQAYYDLCDTYFKIK